MQLQICIWITRSSYSHQALHLARVQQEFGGELCATPCLSSLDGLKRPLDRSS